MIFKEFMTLTLYHYVHCPYCVRVRMALGYLNLDFISKVLPYEDVATPLSLIGNKMLPILANNQEVLKESLDIIKQYELFWTQMQSGSQGFSGKKTINSRTQYKELFTEEESDSELSLLEDIKPVKYSSDEKFKELFTIEL